MRGRTQFDITVQHKDIEGTHFGDQYFPIIEERRNNPFGPSQLRDPFKYICDYCWPLIEQLAPQMSFEGLTLEHLMHSPLYTLQIVKADIYRETRIVRADRCSYELAFYILLLKTAESPEYHAIPRFTAN